MYPDMAALTGIQSWYGFKNNPKLSDEDILKWTD